MIGIMNEGIIKGPFLVLLFLIISFGANWRHECEAATLIAISDSVSVPNERNNMTNNNPISISPPENKTTALVLPVAHANAAVQLQPAAAAETAVVKDIIVVEEDNISIAQRSVPAPAKNETEPSTSPSTLPPCPIENHSERMEDSEIGKQKEEESNVKGGGSGSNLQNGNDKNGPGSHPPVKEEKVETAFEKISESISGVINTIKDSVKSIFSPGHGVSHSGRMDCLNHSVPLTSPGGNDEMKNTTSPNDGNHNHDATKNEGKLTSSNDTNSEESLSSTTSTTTTETLPLNITETS